MYDALTGAAGVQADGAQAVAKIPDAVKRAAMSIESFHKASLVHDDIEDDDDYRYGTASMVRCKLPDEIAHRCFTLSASLGLLLGGIDLRRTPEGEWYCLEVNPSPAFSCFESDTDPEIARAIAQILSHAPRPVAPSVTHHEFHPAPVENHREDRHTIAH